MKIALASDHNGVILKNEIKKYLINKNFEVIDCSQSNLAVDDYSDYAFKLGETIIANNADRGILIDRTGIGMSIAANKIKGIRCAHVRDVNEATLSREHNNVNVLALGTRMNINEILKIIDIFIATEFSCEERHFRRVEKITQYENNV